MENVIPSAKDLAKNGTWWRYKEVRDVWTLDRIRTYKYGDKLYRITDTVPVVQTMNGPFGEFNKVSLEPDQSLKKATHVAFVRIMTGYGVPYIASWEQGTLDEVVEWAQKEAEKLGGKIHIEELERV